jgi:hypothetical protein
MGKQLCFQSAYLRFRRDENGDSGPPGRKTSSQCISVRKTRKKSIAIRAFIRTFAQDKELISE